MVEAAEDGGYGQVTGCRRVCRRQPARACGRLGVQAAMRAAEVVQASLIDRVDSSLFG
jgi:hypothetical protein